MRAHSPIVTATAALWLCVGCWSYVLPREAHIGSTVGFVVAGDEPARRSLENVGFGSLAYEQVGITDDQRGSLVITLHDPSSGTEVGTLDTVLVTRAAADPATDQARAFNPLGGPGLGQVIAIADIPDDAALIGAWDVKMAREDRDGVRHPLDYDLPITILDKTPTTAINPLTAFFRSQIPPPLVTSKDIVTSGDVALIYPHPKAVFRTFPVHAGRVVLSYNTARIDQILDVFPDHHAGREALVLWKQDHPSPGEIEIQYVDPDLKIFLIAVVFTLKDPDGAGIVDIQSDFTVLEQEFYDADGASTSTAFFAEEIR